MHHPWGAFRRLADWTLHFAHLPGDLLGQTDFATKTVTLDSRLTQAERRCTIAHETQHIHRGPVPAALRGREEGRVDRIAARLLLADIRAVGEALAWSQCLEEAADELWVDEATLRTRLRHLHPAERAYLHRRLEVQA
jgi:hypothetical protein